MARRLIKHRIRLHGVVLSKVRGNYALTYTDSNTSQQYNVLTYRDNTSVML